jgi:hypothetical protein
MMNATMAALTMASGDELGDQDVLHLRPREGLHVLPAAELRCHAVWRVARGHPHQHGIDGPAAGLRGLDRVEQARDARAIERGIARGPRPLVHDGVVVLQELRLLRVLEGYEDHRVAARGHHPPRQSHHDVLVPANANPIPDCEPGAHIRHRFVVTAGHTPSGNQVPRLARLARHETDDHGAHVRPASANLHREIRHVGRLCNARHPEQTAIEVVVQAGRLGVRAQGVLLHDPQIGATVVEQHLGVVHHAAIDTGHGERHTDQEPQAQAGEDELAPGVQDVPAGKADHGAAPRSAGTTVTRLSSPRSRSL